MDVNHRLCPPQYLRPDVWHRQVAWAVVRAFLPRRFPSQIQYQCLASMAIETDAKRNRCLHWVVTWKEAARRCHRRSSHCHRMAWKVWSQASWVRDLLR